MPDKYKRLSREELKNGILEKKRKLGENLVILAHHYQRQDIVDVADYLGDSLKLSRIASEQTAGNIVFCGVHFMAEAAAILARPEQRVFIPDPRAGCPLADLADIEDVRKAWEEINELCPDDKVIPITYINSAAELKAFCGENDGVICTSSNAASVMEWAFTRGNKVFFFPDENLGRNSAAKLGIKDMVNWEPGLKYGGADKQAIKKTKLVLWKGYCHVHTFFSAEDLEACKREHPGAVMVVHPECNRRAVEASDEAGSTEGIIKFARESAPGSTIIVGTEIHMVDRLAREFSKDKNIVPLARSSCPNMQKINLRNLLWVLENIERGEDDPFHRVTVPDEIREPALVALRRMLDIK